MIISSQPNMAGSATTTPTTTSTATNAHAAHTSEESVPSNCNCSMVGGGGGLVGVPLTRQAPAIDAKTTAGGGGLGGAAEATTPTAGRDSLTRPASESELNVGKAPQLSGFSSSAPQLLSSSGVKVEFDDAVNMRVHRGAGISINKHTPTHTSSQAVCASVCVCGRT